MAAATPSPRDALATARLSSPTLALRDRRLEGAAIDAHFETDRLRVLKRGPLGPYANNGFVLVDRATNQSALIDAPEGLDAVLEAALGTHIRLVLFTHSHPDHIAELARARASTGAPAHLHPDEPWADHAQVDVHLQGGETLTLGSLQIQVLPTPGHTPGSLCYYIPPVLFSGDTLFPGGPGRTSTADALRTEIASITAQLYPLPEETRVFPGHGDDTTIGASRQEYAAFAARAHDPDLHGDVLWARD